MSTNNANITCLKEFLSSDSSRRVFNALVAVRKLVSKDKNGVAEVLAVSIVSKIVDILRCQDAASEHTSTADIILSILGNMAMDAQGRLSICQAGGIKVVANQFVKTNTSSIQLRSCRVLANLAISTENCREIAECEDVFMQTIKLLQETSSVDLIAVCCRALRLFGQSDAERKKLIGHGAVLPLLKLLKKEDTQLVTSSLRSLCELAASGCYGCFAQQVLDANILEELVKLVDDANSTTSLNALTLLLCLTEVSDIRPSIGAAGGIPLFVRLMTDERMHVNKTSVINALCLCGKEAVNRVKIREHGGLQLFLKSLQDETFSAVHDRLISGLVCFHYDDASIEILLENDLVPVLLQHLQRSACFVSVAESLGTTVEAKRNTQILSTPEFCKTSDVRSDVDVGDDERELFGKSASDSGEKVHQPENKERTKNKTKNEEGMKDGDSKYNEEGMKDNIENKEGMKDKPENEEENKNKIVNKKGTKDETEYGMKFEDEERIKGEKPGSSHGHVFSIDSPTYTINTEWTMVSTPGSATNRHRLSTNTALSPHLLAIQYSPLSNESVVSSPSMSLSVFSPPSSPSSTSPFNIDMYGPIGSKSYMCSSPPPKFSPLGWSPTDSQGSTWHYSSEEDEDESSRVCKDVAKKKLDKIQENIENNENKVVTSSVSVQSDPAVINKTSPAKCDTGEASTSLEDEFCLEPAACGDVPGDLVELCDWKGKRRVSARSPESQILDVTENIPKRYKTDTKKCNILKTTEKNILILVSRISVKTDPSPYLIVSPVLSCLLDYLTLSAKPQARCIRTLSRLLRNPHCLEPLLRIAAPVFIYKNLLLNDDGVDNSAYQLFNRRKTERRSGWSSGSSDSSYSILYDLDLAKYRLVADPQPTSPVRMEQDFDYENRTVSSNICASDDSVIDVAGTGLSLLKDLSFSAASPFGRGVISHILLRKEKHLQTLCSVCLLYLCWSPGMQQNYLINMKVLDQMLALLQSCDVGPLFSAVLCGVIFLVKMVDRPSTLKQSVTRDVFRPISANTTLVSIKCDCLYKSEHFDLFFLIGDKRIGSNRKTLINKSAVFSAMLEGHYTEASQSEIIIPYTSHDALLYVLHYLHGCDLNCPVLLQVEECKKESRTEENVLVDRSLDILALADQYLLNDLVCYMKVVLSSRLLSSHSIVRVLQSSVFHDFRDLCMDCVKELFFMPVSVSCKSSIIRELLNTDKAQTLIETIAQLIHEGAQYI